MMEIIDCKDKSYHICIIQIQVKGIFFQKKTFLKCLVMIKEESELVLREFYGAGNCHSDLNPSWLMTSHYVQESHG